MTRTTFFVGILLLPMVTTAAWAQPAVAPKKPAVPAAPHLPGSTHAAGAVAPGAAAHAHAEAPQQAVCGLVPMKDSKASGTITLTQQHGYVQVSGEVTGLTPGLHGFHIHMFGDLRAPDGMSAGGHFNPGGHMHGGPGSQERHAGDLGNIKADDSGVAKVDVKADGLMVHFVLGRSLVVHAKADDFKTQPSGDSGPRIAVGVIGIAEVKGVCSHNAAEEVATPHTGAWNLTAEREEYFNA